MPLTFPGEHTACKRCIQKMLDSSRPGGNTSLNQEEPVVRCPVCRKEMAISETSTAETIAHRVMLLEESIKQTRITTCTHKNRNAVCVSLKCALNLQPSCLKCIGVIHSECEEECLQLTVTPDVPDYIKKQRNTMLLTNVDDIKRWISYKFDLQKNLLLSLIDKRQDCYLIPTPNLHRKWELFNHYSSSTFFGSSLQEHKIDFDVKSLILNNLPTHVFKIFFTFLPMSIKPLIKTTTSFMNCLQ